MKGKNTRNPWFFGIFLVAKINNVMDYRLPYR
jgi:hypothetical protein